MKGFKPNSKWVATATSKYSSHVLTNEWYKSQILVALADFACYMLCTDANEQTCQLSSLSLFQGLKKMKSKGSMDVVTHLPPQLPSLSDLEARMQLLRESAFEESQGDDDTFAQRAEWFYQRRPLLLSLCLDLYNGYVTLLGRSHQTRPSQQLKPTASHPNHLLHDEEDCVSEVDSGSEISSESTLSFQQMEDPAAVSEKVDELVSQLVTANLDKEILQHELLNKEEQFREAAKTIELLKKFVMLLEMEKEVAMEENANLGYKVTSLLEENRELATEALFMKNEAVGLARCVLKMRDDNFHKVCILQNRIYSLQASQNSEPVYDKVSTGCFGLDKYKTKKKKENKTEDKTGFKWLKKLNNINLFTKPSLNPSAAATAPSCCSLNLPN